MKPVRNSLHRNFATSGLMVAIMYADLKYNM